MVNQEIFVFLPNNALVAKAIILSPHWEFDIIRLSQGLHNIVPMSAMSP
jgi:hypothetical protein